MRVTSDLEERIALVGDTVMLYVETSIPKGMHRALVDILKEDDLDLIERIGCIRHCWLLSVLDCVCSA